MAKSKKPDGSKSKGNLKDDNSKLTAVKLPSSEGLNPHHMFWATQYYKNIPNGLTLLHFDNAIMEALQLDQTTITDASSTII